MSWTDIERTPPDLLAEDPPAQMAVVPSSRGRVAVAFVAGAALSAASFGLGTMAMPRDPAPVVGGVASVANLLGPSVVQVETPNGLGSGVVYEDGFVLTNRHVVDGSSSFIVRTADGRGSPASRGAHRR